MSRLDNNDTPATRGATESRFVSTLGVGLLAMGALAATLLLGRAKSEPVDPDLESGLVPGEAAPGTLRLDALRAAGL